MAGEPEVAVAPEIVPIVSEPAPEPDYKAQLAELQTKITQAEADRARLEQQVASYRGIAGQKLDYEADSKRNTRELRELREEVGTLLDTAMASDDLVAQKVATLRQKRAQETQVDALTQELQGRWDDIGVEIADAYGLDLATQPQEVAKLLQTNPELRNIWALSQQAFQTQNSNLLRQALREAREVRRQSQMTTRQKEVAEAKAAAKKEAEEAVQEKLRESGVLSMPGAKAAGSQGGHSLESILANPISKDASPGELEEIRKTLRAAAR